MIRSGTLVRVCVVAVCSVVSAAAQQNSSTAPAKKSAPGAAAPQSPGKASPPSTPSSTAGSTASSAKHPFVGPPTPNLSAENVTALAEISFVHGGTEPFAVAGYRIGQRALTEFKLSRGSILIEVEHHAPEDVQWTSIADGVQVATGATGGKLNLRIVKSQAGDVSTVIRDRRTGKTLVFRLAPQFTASFATLTHDKLDAAGAAVLDLSDDQIFVMASSQ